MNFWYALLFAAIIVGGIILCALFVYANWYIRRDFEQENPVMHGRDDDGTL